jgi:hypothetical protein
MAMLTRAARLRRGVATLLVLVALVIGTFWGDDDHWPFGPFRMFSIRNRLDGRVKAAAVELTMSDGTQLEEKISSGTLALRRAEVEGQIDRFEHNPALLRHIASLYGEIHPRSSVVGVRLYYEITPLAGGRPAGTPAEHTIATWEDS